MSSNRYKTIADLCQAIERHWANLNSNSLSAETKLIDIKRIQKAIKKQPGVTRPDDGPSVPFEAWLDERGISMELLEAKRKMLLVQAAEEILIDVEEDDYRATKRVSSLLSKAGKTPDDIGLGDKESAEHKIRRKIHKVKIAESLSVLLGAQREADSCIHQMARDLGKESQQLFFDALESNFNSAQTRCVQASYEGIRTKFSELSVLKTVEDKTTKLSEIRTIIQQNCQAPFDPKKTAEIFNKNLAQLQPEDQPAIEPLNIADENRQLVQQMFLVISGKVEDLETNEIKDRFNTIAMDQPANEIIDCVTDIEQEIGGYTANQLREFVNAKFKDTFIQAARDIIAEAEDDLLSANLPCASLYLARAGFDDPDTFHPGFSALRQEQRKLEEAKYGF